MIQTISPITSLQNVAPGIWVMNIKAPEIASKTNAGQFINIKVSDYSLPLLRRPFSIYHVVGDEIKIIFNVVGIGTTILSQKKIGDTLDIIGPLGNQFKIIDDYETALVVGGGMGVATLPILTSAIKGITKKIVSYLGARTSIQLISHYLENLYTATDDGSAGYNGTVVDLLRSHLLKNKFAKPKMFACGPPAMLNSISALTKEFNIPCEISLESVMACGVGICQGCPVELINNEKKYALVCKDGPVFDVGSIRMLMNG